MRIDYTEFKGILNAGEFNDFTIFKDGYNIAFDIESRITLPPHFLKYKVYENQKILNFSKHKVPYLFEGREVDFALTFKQNEYRIYIDDSEFKFSLYPRARGVTISQTDAQNLGIDLKAEGNFRKIYIKNPSLEFLNTIQNLINEYGYFYVFLDDGDYYTEKFFLILSYSYSQSDNLLVLNTAKDRFRRWQQSLYTRIGYPENESNLYSRDIYVFDNPIFELRWSLLHKGVQEFKVYPFVNGFRIHRIYNNAHNESGDTADNFVFLLPSDGWAFQIKKGFIYPHRFNLTESYDMLENPFNLNYKSRLISINLYSRNVNDFSKLYAIALTCLLSSGEEIPLGVESVITTSQQPTIHTVRCAKKIFLLDSNYYYFPLEGNPFLAFEPSKELPPNAQKIYVYLAELTENLQMWAGEYDGYNYYVRYFDAEKVPDSFFVRMFEVDVNGNKKYIPSDITLAELPTYGTRWKVKLYDEISYQNLFIGVGKNNVIYEAHSTAEGVMPDIIPEENFTVLKLSGQVLKLAVFSYRLFVFSDKELYVLDPEKDYQIINKFNIGLIDRNAVVETPFGIVFVSDEGSVFLTDGVRLQELSRDFRETIRKFANMILKAFYYQSQNEVWFICGRLIYVYHFDKNRWSIYGNAKLINDVNVAGKVYLISQKSEIFTPIYSIRSANGDKFILVSYKNNLGSSEVKDLNYFEISVRSDDYYLIIRTDKLCRGFRVRNQSSKIVRLNMPVAQFKWLQFVLYCPNPEDGFEVERISVDYELSNLKYEVSLNPVKFDGITLTAFNEFGLSSEKGNLRRFSKFEDYPQNGEVIEYEASYVYESTFKKSGWGAGRKSDFDYIFEQIINYYKTKKVNFLVTALWTHYNNFNTEDDKNINPDAPIYINPNRPPNMPPIVPVFSYKTLTFGRGGLSGQWILHSQSLNYKIWRLDNIWYCLWVYANGSNYVRNNNGQWTVFERYTSYNDLNNGSEGWYYDYANGKLYIKLGYNVNPDGEQFIIVEKHPLHWSCSDGVYWDYNQLLSPLKHFRMPHPTSGGTQDDYALLSAMKKFIDMGFKVGFYPFLMVTTAYKHGWRGYIKKWDNQVRDAYIKWILHYAKLFKDNGIYPHLFIIGSEMKELEKVNDFADTLVYIADTIKNMLGQDVKITYAMDWRSISEIIGGDTSRNYFENRVWGSNSIDYLGIDFYVPMLNQGDRNEYNPHIYLKNIAGFIEAWYYRHPKPIIVTEYGVSSVADAVYRPYQFPDLENYSQFIANEFEQALGYYSYILYFNNLIKKGIIVDYYIYNVDVRPFPAYPDAMVFDWMWIYNYYADSPLYPFNHNITNKLVKYFIDGL
ncbi:MAG: glycoside hydrolase TIM-barrel-like domain-containing protein [Candidatus Aenigmatarchaeota archaeon]